MGNQFCQAATRSAIALIVTALGFGESAFAALLDRGPNMVYDDALNITWTRNANLPGSSNLTWEQAQAWVARLVVDRVSGWRLPTMDKNSLSLSTFLCAPGIALACAANGNELGFMGNYNLVWNVKTFTKTGTSTSTGGQVVRGVQRTYWSATNNGTDAWCFSFTDARPFNARKSERHSAWAVHQGDVGVAGRTR